MKPFCFRKVDEWKAGLATLPDNAFFEILRSALGNIKTPFSKQKLLDDLYNFLCREDIRGIISSYIDEKDHLVIAAIALLGEPSQGELEDFFTGDIPLTALRSLLLNLEERLIIYRFMDDGCRRITLNPVLEPVLAPFVNDPAPLFPSEPAPQEEEGPRSPVGDSRLLAGLCALVSEGGDLFTGEGQVRKKVIDRGKKLFPGLDLETALGVIQELQLFRGGENMEACDYALKTFAALSRLDRGTFWAAGLILMRREKKEENVYLHRGELRSRAFFLHRFLLLLDKDKIYPETTLLRYLSLLVREDARTSRFPAQWEAKDAGTVIRALEEAGVLESSRMGYRRIHTGVLKKPGESAGPVIGMDGAFSFFLYPEISCADALELSFFCSLSGADPGEPPGSQDVQGPLLHFEITRGSVVRGFDRGIGKADMIDLLAKLSGDRVDDNLAWSLSDWESCYSQVTLQEGLVLSLSEKSCYLAETRHLSGMLRHPLAPGVYLLPLSKKEALLEALEKAGNVIVAQPGGERESPGISEGFSPLSSYRDDQAIFGRGALSVGAAPQGAAPQGEGAGEGGPGEKRESPLDPEEIKDKFRKALEKMTLVKNERDELAARIERRLVLCDAQLSGASIKYEKLEARGLDYAGKAMIAKQALSSGSALEVSLPGEKGTIRKIGGFPEGLEKKGDETILVLKTDEGETMRIPIGKIILLKRIKQSIFVQ